MELQARAAYALAMHAIDDPVRLKVQQVAAAAAASNRDSPSRPACLLLTPPAASSSRLLQLGGVPALVKLLASDDREVLRNACLALTCCAKHPEALPQMYSLKSMRLLIELLSNGNEDVQEQASYTIGYAVFGEDNMKDFRHAAPSSFVFEVSTAKCGSI